MMLLQMKKQVKSRNKNQECKENTYSKTSFYSSQHHNTQSSDEMISDLILFILQNVVITCCSAE